MGQPMYPPPGPQGPPPGPSYPPPGAPYAPPGPPAPAPAPAPKRGMSTGCLVGLLAGIFGGGLVIVLMAALLIAADTSTDPTADPTPGVNPNSVGDTGFRQSEPAPPGTFVSPAKGWNVLVESAELDGDATVKEGSSIYEPDPGTRFVVVEITVMNVGDDPNTFFDDVDLSLLSSSGVATEQCRETFPGKLDQSAQLQPGASNTGKVCFMAPIEGIPTSVLLAEPVLTRDPAKDQRFLALT